MVTWIILTTCTFIPNKLSLQELFLFFIVKSSVCPTCTNSKVLHLLCLIFLSDTMVKVVLKVVQRLLLWNSCGNVRMLLILWRRIRGHKLFGNCAPFILLLVI